MTRFLAALVLLAGSPAFACDGLVAAEGWIRAAPPGAGMTAGYVKLANTGKAALKVDSAKSPAFGSVELHRTVLRDGVYQMTEQALVLEGGERVALEPGSWHLMLFDPKRPLKAGDTVSISLQCGAAAQAFDFTVKAP